MAAVLHRHRRLLVLCACSACAHFAVLGWMTARPAPAPAAVQGAAQALRLMLVQPAARAPAQTALPPKKPRERASDLAARAAPTAAAPVAARPAPAGAEPAQPEPAQPEPAQPDPMLAEPGHATSLADIGAHPVQMPGRYRVRTPESVLIRYTVVQERPGSPPAAAGDASLDWQSSGAGYRLRIDGVLGRLASEGVAGDAGIVPRRAGEDRAGAVPVTEFGADEVRFGATGASFPASAGIQDHASLLMQLAGIGLGDPAQLKDVLEVVVAGSAEAAIARLRVLGVERLETGAGGMDAWHLAGMVAPGAPRLDVWLAPAHGWLPVRIRVSGPDGALTQTASAIVPGGRAVSGDDQAGFLQEAHDQVGRQPERDSGAQRVR